MTSKLEIFEECFIWIRINIPIYHVLVEELRLGEIEVGRRAARVQEQANVLEAEHLTHVGALVHLRHVDGAGQQLIGQIAQYFAVAQRIGKLAKCELVGGESLMERARQTLTRVQPFGARQPVIVLGRRVARFDCRVQRRIIAVHECKAVIWLFEIRLSNCIKLRFFVFFFFDYTNILQI